MPQHTPEEQAKNQALQQQQQPVQNDLGRSLTQPQQQPAAASPSFANATNEFFQDPVNRAGLLSFGLNLMQGGFGTPLQQFAHAAGQGIESAAGAEEFQTAQRRLDEEQDFKERQLGQRATLAREGEAGALERSQIAARTRIQAAGLTGTSLANKALSQAGAEFTAVGRALRANRLQNPMTDEEIQAAQQQAADNKLRTILGLVEEQFPGSVGGPIAGGQTSPIPGAAPPPAQVPQPPPAAGQSTPNAAREQQRIPLSSLQNSPNFQRALQLDQTPAGKLQLWNRGIVPSPPFTPPREAGAVFSGGQGQGTANPLNALQRGTQ